MTTHGNIQFVSSCGEGSVWLHAHSDGHTAEAVRDLKSLPSWIVRRAVMQQKMEKEDIGPWWMDFIKESDPGVANRIGVLSSIEFTCEYRKLAAMMVSKRFLRWLPCDSPEGRPDITVECSQHSYVIQSAEYGDFKVDFSREVLQLFNQALEKRC